MVRQTKQMDNERRWRHKWSLTGHELLLEIEYRDGSSSHGIYALDPFEGLPTPKLLVEGGERPCWSAKRNFFAYLHGEYLRVARSDGTEDIWVAVADFEQCQHEQLVSWNQREGFTLFDRNTGYGSLCYPLFKSLSVYSSLADLEVGAKDPFTFIPLKQPMSMPTNRRPNMQAYEWWNDLLAANNLSFSPDARYFAAEVYPTPLDLRRGESRIYIFEENPQQKPTVRWYHWGLMLHAPGRRLTKLTGTSCELNPLWSPTGEWIAFTLVDFQQGYVAPVVIRPDGSDMTLLLPRSDILELPAKWKEYGVPAVDNRKYRKGMITLTRGWGTPNLQAVQWSPDGRYLMLNSGRLYTVVSVVKQEGAHWRGKTIFGENFSRLTQWHARSGWLCWVPGLRAAIDRVQSDTIKLQQVETNELKSISLSDRAIIHWMSG